MTVKLSPIFNDAQITGAGIPLSGGKLYWYIAGTSTPQNTYTDNTGATPQANPIILNTRGEPDNPIWLTAGVAYKAVLKDSLDNLIRTVDNISGINDVTSPSFSEWTQIGLTATYISSTSFSVPGDQTSIITSGRRLKAVVSGGNWYGYVSTATFGAGVTTVVVISDSIPMDSGLSSLQYGNSSADHPSIPDVYPTHGQCRLTLATGNLKLSPYNGNHLIINGVRHVVPSAGVTLSPSGLIINTTYFIYAYMNGATMTLEASTTGHSTDTNTGVETKSGDLTRSLVGMARTVTGPAFADSATQRFVISWFNRRNIQVANNFAGIQTITSVTFVEFGTPLRNEFLTWSDESIVASMVSRVFHQTANFEVDSAIYYDGTSTQVTGAITGHQNSTNLTPHSIAVNMPLSEGYHYTTLCGAVGSGTGQWSAGTYLQTIIRG